MGGGASALSRQGSANPDALGDTTAMQAAKAVANRALEGIKQRGEIRLAPGAGHILTVWVTTLFQPGGVKSLDKQWATHPGPTC